MLRVGVLGLVAVAALGAQAFADKVPAADAPAPAAYTYVLSTATPPDLSVRAYLVADIKTGEVLLAATSTTPYPIASVTKLIVAGAALSLPTTATTTITVADIETPEVFGRLAVGEVYTLHELLFPYLIESSNDAGAAIARLGGQTLTDAVAAEIAAAGVEDGITLTDTTGLSPRNVASADALLSVSRHLWQRTPHIFDISRLPRYQGQYTQVIQNNPIATMPGYQGGKHGYTPEAGRTSVAVLRTPFPDGERDLVYIVLGAESLRETMATLTEHVAATITRAPATSAILPASVE